MEVSIRRVAAATRIQAAFRGRLVRRELIDAVRVDFEEVMRRVEGPLAARVKRLDQLDRHLWGDELPHLCRGGARTTG